MVIYRINNLYLYKGTYTYVYAEWFILILNIIYIINYNVPDHTGIRYFITGSFFCVYKPFYSNQRISIINNGVIKTIVGLSW